MNYLTLLHIPAPVDPESVHVDENGIITENSSDAQSMLDTLLDIGTIGVVKVVDWGTSIITMIFVVAVILMIISSIFKVGQWQKFAQNTMLWSFIAMLFLRAIPITILSLQSEQDIDQAISSGLIALSQITIFIGITGVLLSLLFKFGYKLIEHPEYHRWSKNVLSVSTLMIFFALVGPQLFRII